jgi:hypothetical protein
MRNGSRITFSATPKAIRYSGVRVSPQPRNSAWKMKKPNMNTTPRKMVRVYSTARRYSADPGVAPTRFTSVGVSRYPRTEATAATRTTNAIVCPAA